MEIRWVHTILLSCLHHDVDTLDERMQEFPIYSLNFEAGEESRVVDQLRADWGFEGFGIDPNSSRMHNRVSELGIDQIISEFDSTKIMMMSSSI